MKKRISKKSLLSLLTVSAIVVTMVGSYAVWDELSKSTNAASLTIDQATKVELTNLSYTPAARSDFSDPVYTSEPVTVKATNVPNIKTELDLSATVTDGSSNDITGDFTVVILDTADQNASVVKFADKTEAETGGAYKVKITPKDNTHAGETINVTLNAELKKDTATP